MPPTRPRLSRLATLCAVTLLGACSEPVPMGSAVYRHDAKTPRCESGSRPGAALATILALVARKWYIDEACIYLTGQSDRRHGCQRHRLFGQDAGNADAIAPSAAGLNGKDLAEYGTICGGDQSHSDWAYFSFYTEMWAYRDAVSI
jgi:hypothetical protein